MRNGDTGYRIVDIDSNADVGTLQAATGATGWVSNLDGSRIATLGGRGNISLFREQESSTANGPMPAMADNALRLSADGRTLVVGGRGGELYVARLDGDASEAGYRLRRVALPALALQYEISPDGTSIVTAEADGTVSQQRPCLRLSHLARSGGPGATAGAEPALNRCRSRDGRRDDRDIRPWRAAHRHGPVAGRRRTCDGKPRRPVAHHQHRLDQTRQLASPRRTSIRTGEDEARVAAARRIALRADERADHQLRFWQTANLPANPSSSSTMRANHSARRSGHASALPMRGSLMASSTAARAFFRGVFAFATARRATKPCRASARSFREPTPATSGHGARTPCLTEISSTVRPSSPERRRRRWPIEPAVQSY